MKKIVLSIFTSLVLIYNTQAQEIENLIKAANDANTIANAYAAPALEGLIYSMNNGWFHTAKVHKVLGFDLSIGVNGSFIPTEKENYSISNLNLESNIISAPKTSPTIFGKDTSGKLTLKTKVTGQISGIGPEVERDVLISLDLPKGFQEDLPLNVVPAPAIQLNVGLPWKFEGSLRLVPTVGSDDVEGSLFGIGLKKELTSLLGSLDKLPLHLAVMATYTSMNVDAEIEDSNDTDFIIRNAKSEFRLNAYSIQALASINFPIINFYGAIGYGTGDATLSVLGNYKVTYDVDGTSERITTELNNPIKQEFNAGSMRATIGTRLSLGFFKIFADYTLQEYNTLNAGIAFNIR